MNRRRALNAAGVTSFISVSFVRFSCMLCLNMAAKTGLLAARMALWAGIFTFSTLKVKSANSLSFRKVKSSTNLRRVRVVWGYSNVDEYYLSTSCNRKTWCLCPAFHYLFYRTDIYVIKLTFNENCTFGTIWLFGPCFVLYCLVISFELNQI